MSGLLWVMRDGQRRMAADALDAGTVGGAPLGRGGAAAAEAADAGGDCSISRGQPGERVALGRGAAPAGPARTAGAAEERATTAARGPRLDPAGSALGARRAGGGLRHRALDLAAHRGAHPARVWGALSSALSRTAAQGAWLFGAAPHHPRQGARRVGHRPVAEARLGSAQKKRGGSSARFSSWTRPATASGRGRGRPGRGAAGRRCSSG